uniref:F5/8 type C domain-containing protein n=1 Tax=Heterorhabditis bacteriophora TaxID=37862 RepID=A0A1I7WJV5_HETBA
MYARALYKSFYISAYDFDPIGLRSNSFWYFVIPIAIVFIVLVICAIIWLRSNQEPSTSKCLTGKPPPPPRIPPPVTPAEYQQSHNHLGNQEYSLEKTRHVSPVILNNSMFQQKFPMGIATLDRKNIQKAQRGYDEMPNLYDSGSPQPYWHHIKGNSQSIYMPTSGNYRTLEVTFTIGSVILKGNTFLRFAVMTILSKNVRLLHTEDEL